MPWRATEFSGVVDIKDGHRIVRIPDEIVLVGDAITIRQEKDGVITIHPATDEGRRALEPFNPFGDWTEEDWKRFEEYDWSSHPLFGRQRAKA